VLNAGPDKLYAFLGNEPTAGTPWEYDFLGEPWRAQEVVRRAVLQLYSALPGDLPGNDDLGQTSAWYVFAALGLYPEVPGVGGLVIGSPLFPRVMLHLAGDAVTISAPRALDTTPYMQGLRIDGRPYARPWLPLSALACGADLRFDLGATPNKTWGAAPGAAPPWFDAAPLRARSRPLP